MTALLPIRLVEKPWGRDRLPTGFPDTGGAKLGELWFEPPAALDQLLVKYIFTSEALSVQVHPSDAQRPGHGKEECWLVIDAEPGACLGIGLREPADPATLRAAALSGAIEQMLEWHPVRAGDFFYIPANTVHAIGAGVTLIEVQQNSDVTYRLYDYGRPRELHLDEGLAVARGEPHGTRHRQHVAPDETKTLVDGPLFRLDQVRGQPGAGLAARYLGALLVIPRSGPVLVAGEPVAPGECALADHLDQVEAPVDAVMLLTQPAKAASG